MAVRGGGFGAVWEFADLDGLVRTQEGGFVPGSTWWRENVVLVGDGVDVGVWVDVFGVERVGRWSGGGW